MKPTVSEKVAQAVAAQNNEKSVLIIWHGGEPTAIGIPRLYELVQPFEDLRKEGKVHHNIQTNGTLIDEKWCEFIMNYQFRVGVSIDGPEWANVKRVDLSNRPIYSRTMQGIRHLKENNIPFGVIAVVHEANIERPEEFYDFFCNLGCDNLSINIEEIEGVNTQTNQIVEDKVSHFWRRLFIAQQSNPVLRIREFDSSFRYLESVLSNTNESEGGLFEEDLFPTVAWNGDVYLLSPEFGGYKDFVVGNLSHSSLTDILTAGRESQYVVDFEKGVKECKEQCAYYQACGGGYASNKYFEHGTTKATETSFCRNARIKLLDAILESV